MRKDPSVPEYLQKSFNSSFSAAEENTVWFKSFHRQIGNWSTITVHELGLDADQSNSTTLPSEATTKGSLSSEATTKGSLPSEATTSANKHEMSSGATRSNGAGALVFTLQIVSSTLLVNYVLRLF